MSSLVKTERKNRVRGRGRVVLAATLLTQMRQPHEMTRLTLLLLIVASLRLRGFTIEEPTAPARPIRSKTLTRRAKGFQVKRPRSRFL